MNSPLVLKWRQVFDERCLLQKLIDVKFYLKFDILFSRFLFESTLMLFPSFRSLSTFPFRSLSAMSWTFVCYVHFPFVHYELDIRPGDADSDINRNTCCAVLIAKFVAFPFSWSWHHLHVLVHVDSYALGCIDDMIS
jgi:hypothetical protein